jgi:predicted RNA binding protein YcfA (HicA-like mRNA interferase family)
MQSTKRLLFIFLSFSAVILAYSQNCDCKSNFDWMKKTFEENDAGFQYVVNTKGKHAYFVHNQLFEKKIIPIKNNYECAEILNEWLLFFRKVHIGIEILKDDLTENTQEMTPYGDT